jgi:hypothetical protein
MDIENGDYGLASLSGGGCNDKQTSKIPGELKWRTSVEFGMQRAE